MKTECILGPIFPVKPLFISEWENKRRNRKNGKIEDLRPSQGLFGNKKRP